MRKDVQVGEAVVHASAGNGCQRLTAHRGCCKCPLLRSEAAGADGLPPAATGCNSFLLCDHNTGWGIFCKGLPMAHARSHRHAAGGDAPRPVPR